MSKNMNVRPSLVANHSSSSSFKTNSPEFDDKLDTIEITQTRKIDVGVSKTKNMNVRPSPVANLLSLYPALAPYHTVVAVADTTPHTLQTTQTDTKDRIVISSSNIHPPTFDGETGNVDDWIETFEITAVANEWSDSTKMKKVPVFLNGAAREFHLDFKHRNSKLDPAILAHDNEWSHFKILLRQTFGFFDTAISNFDAMKRRKQQLGGNTMVYFLSKLSLIRKYNPEMDEKEKVLLITQGLLATMLERIYLFQCKTVDDLKEKLSLLAEGQRLANTRGGMTTTTLLAQGSRRFCDEWNHQDDESENFKLFH